MREYTKKSENQSRTLDSNPKASRQAPLSEILQAYKGNTTITIISTVVYSGKDSA